MKKIAVIGAGGFGREVKMLIDQINQQSKSYDFIGYYDDGMAKGTLINGFPVLGGIDEINSVTHPLGMVVAIGTPAVKKKVLSKISNHNVDYPVLIHPSVYLETELVSVGEGSIICSGTILTVNIVIGAHVILNLACTVGHDTVIGNFSSFMPGVNVSGEVKIAEGVYVGTGSTIVNQLEIGEYSVIGAGAVVAKSIPANCTAVGIPAKPIKYH